MKHTKAEIALKLHESGYSCAQSVLGAFASDFGLEQDTAFRIASCFGGGMRMGATCGALTGALMVLGLARCILPCDAYAKELIETECKAFISLWRNEMGQTDCREILGIDVCNPQQRQAARDSGLFAKLCPSCIETAVELLETTLRHSRPRSGIQ